MVGSFFGGSKPPDVGSINVAIERTSSNTRRISASVIVDSSMDDCWSILTDYNNLATHVPNLVQSTLIKSPTNGIRLYQEGAQKIIGFDFSASLTMDMTEVQDRPNSAMPRKAIQFKLVESRFFSEFDGKWQLQAHSRRLKPGTTDEYLYKTKLFYEVFIRPNGPVPVLPLEWRIREDVPSNLLAVKEASERRSHEVAMGLTEATPAASAVSPPQDRTESTATGIDWEAEETLDLYMRVRK